MLLSFVDTMTARGGTAGGHEFAAAGGRFVAAALGSLATSAGLNIDPELKSIREHATHIQRDPRPRERTAHARGVSYQRSAVRGPSGCPLPRTRTGRSERETCGFEPSRRVPTSRPERRHSGVLQQGGVCDTRHEPRDVPTAPNPGQYRSLTQASIASVGTS